MNVDKWAVQIVMGTAALGVYSFAMNLVSVGMVLVNMVQLYATPRMLRSFGESPNGALLLRGCGKIARSMIVVLVVGLTSFHLLLPVLVSRWYPQYDSILDWIFWVYAAVVAVSLGFYDVLFRAVANGRNLLVIQLYVVAFTAVCCIIAATTGAGIAAFAASFAAGRILTTGVAWAMGAKAVHRSRTVQAAP
jgi:O-antigen/teichoic acid export membrane protein